MALSGELTSQSTGSAPDSCSVCGRTPEYRLQALDESMQLLLCDTHFVWRGPGLERFNELGLMVDARNRALRGLLDGIKAMGGCICIGDDKRGHEAGCQVVEARRLVG